MMVAVRCSNVGRVHSPGRAFLAGNVNFASRSGSPFYQINFRCLPQNRCLIQTEINYLREKYAPLRGEPWYRREPTPGSKVGKKVLDIYFLKETLPELLNLLLGDEENGGVGLSTEQVTNVGMRKGPERRAGGEGSMSTGSSIFRSYCAPC